MERNQFLIYITTATGLMPLLLAEISCSDNGDNGNDTGSSVKDESFTVVSSTTNEHTHTVAILFTDVNAPPSTGKTLTTSGTSHTHNLILSQSDFQSLRNDQQISRDTSTDASHKHRFTIKVPGNSTNGGGY